MKFLYFILFCLLLQVPTALAQGKFAPEGAEWCLRGYDGEDRTLGYVLASYKRDSVVAGHPTKVFSIRVKDLTPRGLMNGYYSPIELFQQFSDSVYYYIPQVRDRVYLFKESYAEGDTTTSSLYNDPYLVSSSTEEIIDGVTLPVAKMNLLEWLNRDLPVTMYGAIGPDRGFISYWGYFLEGRGGENLEAYRADNVDEIQIVPRSQCFALMDKVENLVTTPIQISTCSMVAYPNPITTLENFLTINFDCKDTHQGDFQLEIYGLGGQSTMRRLALVGFPARVSVAGLPTGQYFAVVTGEGQRYTFTFTKVR